MRDILIFFAISIPSFSGVQRGMDILHASTDDSGAVMLAKFGHFLTAAEVVALFLPFVLGALVAGLAAYRRCRHARPADETLRCTLAVLVLSCVLFGVVYAISPVGELFLRDSSFGLGLLLALIPLIVTLIYWAVFPFTVRFMVARRGAAD